METKIKRRLFAVSVLALLLVSMFGGLGVWQIKPAHATTIFSSGFESGGFISDGWDSTTGSPTVQTNVVHHGTYAMQATATSTYASKSWSAQSTCFMRFYVNVSGFPSSDGQYETFVESNKTGGYQTTKAGVYNDAGTVKWFFRDSMGVVNLNNATYPVINTFYSFELGLNVTAAKQYLYIDDVQLLEVSWEGASNIQGMSMGACYRYGGGTWNTFIDCVVVANAYIGVGETANYTLTINSTSISVPYMINGTEAGYAVNAASGYWQDIQDAVDDVTAHGGIGDVRIPEGTFNFVNVSETWTDGRVVIPAGVNLFGAPTERDANGQVVEWKTILVMPWEVPTDRTWFQYTINNNKPLRVSDIKFIGYRYYNVSSTTMYTAISFTGQYAEYPTIGILDFRIDHCHFQDLCGGAISFGIHGEHNRRVYRGVIDHNILNNTYGDPGLMNYANRTLGYGIGMRRWACDVWDYNLANVIGQYTNYTIFVEDNYFSKWRHCISSNDGFHFVFRYNIVEDGYAIGEADGHGSYADYYHPYGVGTRAIEVYNNTFKDPDTTWYPLPWVVNIRGGSAIVFNNTLIGYYALCDLNNDWGNYAPYCPQCHINQTYIWNNTLGGAILIKYNSDNTENVNYFLRAPNQTLDGFTYTPYTYPHPLTAETYGYTNDTVSLEEGTYLVTVPASTISEGNTFLFSKWQDDSTNTTLTVSLTANTTVTATYTIYVIDTSDTVGVVGVTGTYGYAAVEYAVQRKTFYANGRFWVFYFNGTISANSTVYGTSTDGLSWSSSVNMTNRTGSAGWQFAVTFNGTYLSYAFSTSTDGDPLYYRAGTPNSDGTITWLNTEQNVTTGESNTGHLWPTIAIDSGGYPWIAYARKNVTENTRYAYITKSSTNNGTWTAASGFPHQLSSENYTCIQALVVPLTNQKVLAIASNTHTPIKSFQWNGSSWGTQQNATSSIADVSIFFSAVNQGDDVHLAFVKNSTYDLIHTKYSYSSDSWGAETTVQSTVTDTTSPVLSIDTLTNDLYLFWAGSPEANAIYFKKYNGTNWAFTEESNPWITETALAGYYKYDGLSGFYQTYDHKIGLAYTNGTTVYYVKFKYFNITAPEVTVTVTYPANTTYTTPTVTVQISASGGIVDTVLWNCTFTNGTVVYANTVYTTPTSMTLGDGAYIFNAWANNTDGDWDEGTVMFTVLITATPPPSGERKTTIWVWPQFVNTTAEADEFISWCLDHYINQIAIAGEISDENRSYLASFGFDVFQTVVCTLDPPPDYNYGDYMSDILVDYGNYSGIILNDENYLWYKARQNNLTQQEALENYQSFISYAEAILTPYYGADNVRNIMPIWADDVNYTLMQQVNTTSSVFSYYYPPDPVIRYFSSYNWFNTSASGWDVKSFYQQYAPSNYYQYEGWIWIPSATSDYPTDSILKTFNGIVSLNQSYATQNIQIYGYDTIANNTKYSRLLKYLCKMWLEGVSSPIVSDAVYIYNWTETYWQELFDTLPDNQSTVTYEGWQFTQNNANFTYAVSDGQFILFWNGSRSEAGWGSFGMQRAFTTELGLNMSLEFTPVADMIGKSIIITEGTASDSLGAYRFGFGAFTYDLNFIFVNVSRLETTINLGKWTPNCAYTIQFNIDMEGCSVKIENSTWTWTYTIPSSEFRYNSVNTRTLLVQAMIGNLTNTNTVVWRMNFTNTNRLTPWNPPFEFLNYTAYYQAGFYVFLEEGLLANWTYNPVAQSATMCLYGETASNLILNCTEPTSVQGDILGYGYLDNKLTIELSAPSSSQSVSVSWAPIYVEPVPPLTLPDFLPYLWAGDFFGFIIATYTSSFGSADIFFGVVIMLVMVPLYIRTKSLMFMSILWILLGSLFLVAMPLVSGLAVLLLVLGVGSMLFEVFMINRRG